jgi:hypothetical protein
MKKIAAIIFFIAVSTVSLSADIITLKDGQEFPADVTGYDNFYLNLTAYPVTNTTGGLEVSVPWAEVESIKHTTTEPDWLLATHITPEEADVTTLVVPLSRDTAFLKSLFPGIAMHGAGHFYGRDKNTGMSLVSAEIVSLIMMGLSAAEIIQPEEGSQASTVSRIVFFSGLTVFCGSWLYDLVFSGGSVDRFNSDNKFLIQEKKNNDSGAGQ